MKKTLILTSAALLVAGAAGAAVATDQQAGSARVVVHKAEPGTAAGAADGEREPRRVVVRHAAPGTATATAQGEVAGDKKVFVVVRGDAAAEGGDGPRVMVRELDADSPELQRFRVRHPGGTGAWPGDLASRGYLGVHLVELTPELRAHFGAREESGVLVGRVEADSPAQRAGIEVGDVITHVDGEKVGSSFELVRKVGERKEGDVVGLEVVRDGRVELLSATVVERERPQIEARTLLRRLGDGGTTYELDPEALSVHVQSLHEHFSSPEWKARMEELARTGELIEERLKVLEIELDDLEKHIDVEVEVKESEGAATSDGN